MISIWNVLTGLLGFISGPLTALTNKIIDLKIKQADAKTEQERIRVSEEIATLDAQRAVLVAESQPGATRLNAFIRVGFALPCILYLWQVIAYDKVISVWITGHTHNTDDLSTGLWKIVLTVIGFYFTTVMVTHAAAAVAKVVKR